MSSLKLLYEFAVPQGDHQEHPGGGEGAQLTPPPSDRPGHQGARDQDWTPGGGGYRYDNFIDNIDKIIL